MAESIDEVMLIAWVDGELDPADAERVARAVSADPDLAAMGDRHRAMKARFAAAFGPIADEPVAMPAPAPAPVISLAAARADREARAAAKPVQRWWGVDGAVAASLLVGVLVGHGVSDPAGIADRPDALALSSPIAQALDGQLSGETGAVRVALSFKDHDGHFCRSFNGQNISGVACRGDSGWRLRYASPASPQQADYRMAGGDADEMRFIQSVIAGDPLDHDDELKARASRWGR